MTHLIIRTFFVVLLLSPFYSNHAQTVRTDRLDSVFPISSSVLGEARQIIVRVPPGYHRGTAKYPVVYMLDGHQPHIRMMEGILDQQSSAARIPELILVSIPNVNRDRDMTPTKTARIGSGGADKFLQFIESEIFPLVEKHYRTQPYRIIAGHSLAGLAAVNAMISKPAMFNAYIAASPVLHWDNNYPVKKSSELFKNVNELNKTLFVAVGDEPTYLPAIDNFRELLERSKVKKLDFDFQHWKNEDHGTVVLRTYLDGLRHAYDGWVPDPKNATVGAFESHYDRLSKRYGYEIKIPENILNQLGYGFLRADRTLDAIDAFKKNTELYPESANVHDSLAEAYEKNGSKDKAREHYEKAYRRAELTGEAQLARSAKSNFDRLSSKN
jgi:predicted alpha/beta superfamily hydrolase